MTQKQDFASRVFVNADGQEVSANGAPVGSAEEQLQKLNDIESLRQKVRDLTDENETLKGHAPAEPDQELLNELAQVKTERDGLKQQAEAVAGSQQTSAQLLADTQQQLRDARADLEALRLQLEQAQNATAQQLAVPEGAQLIPADARDRLIGIKGVGEKLADEILTALAPSPEAQS